MGEEEALREGGGGWPGAASLLEEEVIEGARSEMAIEC